jgi:hypothetical protein
MRKKAIDKVTEDWKLLFSLRQLHSKSLQHHDGGRHCHYVAALLDKVTSAINALAKGRFSEKGQLGDGLNRPAAA